MLSLLAAYVISQVTLVPDMNYEPKLGDDVRIYRRDSGRLVPAPCTSDAPTFEQLAQAIESKDPEGLRKLIELKQVVPIDSGSRIRILEVSTVGISVQSIMGPGGVRRNVYTQDARYRWYKVRLLEGSHFDQVFFVDKDYAKRCALVDHKAKKRSSRP